MHLFLKCVFGIKHMFRPVPLSIIRSFSLYTAMVYVIQVTVAACEQDQNGTAVPSWSCSQAVSKPVWHIPLLYVQWKTPDDGQRNCPKHLEFYSKNKFEKLVHLVGCIIRIYHDARSPERQIHLLSFSYLNCSNGKSAVVAVACSGFRSYSQRGLSCDLPPPLRQLGPGLFPVASLPVYYSLIMLILKL